MPQETETEENIRDGKVQDTRDDSTDNREGTSSLRKQLDSQTKELNQRMRQIEELREKERIANENVEGLMTDIAAAEEEIARWKLHVLKEELEEAKPAIKESGKKLKFKEETAAAAMGKNTRAKQ
ncbi:Uncharacterized protein Rs2_36860 [Raphanus sativus]|nr:Uncharacterized protein Rs2_36860 [Raphanus sativus]